MSLLLTLVTRNVRVRLGHYERENGEARNCSKGEEKWRIQSGRLGEVCRRDIHVVEEADADWDDGELGA